MGFRDGVNPRALQGGFSPAGTTWRVFRRGRKGQIKTAAPKSGGEEPLCC
jgi:hypothetical protein